MLAELDDPRTRRLARALLSQPVLRVRPAWARLQLTLWAERGWVQMAADHHYRLTAAGRRRLQQGLLEQQLASQVDAETRLQRLGVELPAHCHPGVLAALLQGRRDMPLGEALRQRLQEAGITARQDGQLRLRAGRGFSLYFQDGGLLDAGPWLAQMGELSLPRAGLERLARLLWPGSAPRILTVDSRAAFLSLVPGEELCLVHCPHGHTELAEQFMLALGPQYRWSHLCDLTPAALVQARQLAARLGRAMSLMVPTNLDDYVSLLAQPLPEGVTWSLAGLSPGQQRQLGELARLRAGLEQEALALASDWQMLD